MTMELMTERHMTERHMMQLNVICRKAATALLMFTMMFTITSASQLFWPVTEIAAAVLANAGADVAK
jgi:hypothetical protein